ncbi:MAG: hypothetical protein WC975_10620 [Phycisphaerae bacterium]
MTNISEPFKLPIIVEQYLTAVTRRIHNRCVRSEVLMELRNHFTEALLETSDADREKTAKELIENFGDVAVLGQLIKRAKKRCRPAWQKFLIRSLQALAALIVLLIGYAAWFYFDKPNPTIDYVAEFNELVRPKVDESQNAAPYYIEAQKLLVNPSDDVKEILGYIDSSLAPNEEKNLRLWLKQNEKAFAELQEGSHKSYFWYTYNGKETISILLTYLAPQRALAKGLCWKMWLEDGNNQQQILQDLRTLYQQSRHLQTQTVTLIEQLVGLAVQTLADQQVLRLLKAGKIKTESLPELAKMLEEIYPVKYPKMDIQGERLFALDVIQRIFTDNGIGGGHICPKEMNKYLHYSTESKEMDSLFSVLSWTLIHPRRDVTTAKVNEYYDLFEKETSVKPYDRDKSGKPLRQKFLENNLHNFMIKFFVPALSRAIEMNFRGKVGLEATQTVIALQRYKQEHGNLPENLTALIPVYLNHLPQDPYGPGPLTYKRQGSDFILYTFGQNYEDDGGKHEELWGTSRTNLNGDYVFWPPQPKPRPAKQAQFPPRGGPPGVGPGSILPPGPFGIGTPGKGPRPTTKPIR